MSARTRFALAGAVAVVGLMVVACTPPSAPRFVPSQAGVVTSRESTPTDTTFVLADGQQLTFGAGAVRWLSGMPGEGDLLLAGTTPTRWAATLSGNIEGPGGLRPCYLVSGPAWDRGDHLEISFVTGDGPITLIVSIAPTWTSPGTIDSGQLLGTYTCLDANGRAVASG